MIIKNTFMRVAISFARIRASTTATRSFALKMNPADRHMTATPTKPIYDDNYANKAIEQQLSSISQPPTVTPATGLNKFMSRVFTRMGLGVGGTIGVSLLLMPFAIDAALPLFFGGFIGSMGSIVALNMTQPKYGITTDGEKYLETNNQRELAFGGLSLGMGVMLSPFMTVMMSIDPTILPASVLMSGGIFGGCAYVAAKNPKNLDIMNWKAPLMIGMGTLLTTQLIGLGSMIFFGPNPFSEMIHNIDIYGGIGLFTLMSVYDVHVAREMYQNGKPDHIGCAVSVYLDFMNLLIRIMEAMAKAKK